MEDSWPNPGPLHLAARYDRTAMATKLLQEGADVNAVNSYGTPLHWAVRHRSKVTAIELLRFGADVTAVDKYGDTSLHSAAENNCTEIASVLLRQGADVNAENRAGDTPLHWAAKNNCKYIASVLLRRGADVDAVNKEGDTPFQQAEWSHSKDVARLLQRGAEPPPLFKWFEPESEAYRSKIAQVVRNQESSQIELFHYHNDPIKLGYFCSVHVGVDGRNGREVAVKRVEKERFVSRDEIAYLVKLPNCEDVVRYLGLYEDTHFVFLILDLMEGTLIEYLDKTPRDTSLNKTLCRDIVNGLHFLHQNNVLHRDIKPENVLYKESPRVCLKIADFGLSAKTVFNTRCWMAPELLKATEQIKHTEESDVFACGLVLHFLLAEKQHPFTKPPKTGAILQRNETEQNMIEYKPFLRNVLSPEARNLLETMLVKDKYNRPKTVDVLSHPFFWSEPKATQFLIAVGNQPELVLFRGVTKQSPVTVQLENTLGNDFKAIGWENAIQIVYEAARLLNPICRYDTGSAVHLVRFVRNVYAHVSNFPPTAPITKLLMEDFVFFQKFPSLLIEVYKTIKAHGWDKSRIEIEAVLKMN